MERKTIVIDEKSVNVLVGFFNLLGYETYARELSHAWDQYTEKMRALLNVRSGYEPPDSIDGLHNAIKGHVAEYENAFSEIKKAFSYFAAKTAVMTDEAKWRRSFV
jgi:hypothetical protein